MSLPSRRATSGKTKTPAKPRGTAAPERAVTPDKATRSLTIALLRARESLLSRFRPMLAGHDFTAQQWRALRMLSEHKILDAAQLAEKAFILPPSLTRILANLEARQLVTRLQPTTDRRRYLFCLTKKGEDAFHAVMPESMEIYAEVEAYLGKEQIVLLLDLLDKLSQF